MGCQRGQLLAGLLEFTFGIRRGDDAGTGTQPRSSVPFVNRAQSQRRVKPAVGRKHHYRTGIQLARALIETQDGVYAGRLGDARCGDGGKQRFTLSKFSLTYKQAGNSGRQCPHLATQALLVMQRFRTVHAPAPQWIKSHAQPTTGSGEAAL